MGSRSWINDEQDLESCCSQSGSIIDTPTSNKSQEHYGRTEGMLKLNEESNEFILLKHRFYLSIGNLVKNCTVVNAFRNLHNTPMAEAQLEAFKIYMNATSAKRGGNPNVMHAWYGATKEEIDQILRGDGFNVGASGLHLYPERCAGDSVVSAPVDEDGHKHMVVCRVILGKSEVIPPGTKQSCPSSSDFDSGVDSLELPSKYIVWCHDVKTNILPLYALTVKLDEKQRDVEEAQASPKQPTSPWMPFTMLVYTLSKFLSHSSLCMIRRFHTNFMERRTSRKQFVDQVRQITGDKLLVFAIKEYQKKKLGGSSGRAGTRMQV